MAANDNALTETGELRVGKADFTFSLPNGLIKSTSLTDDEVRSLVGTRHEYKMDWWVHGAETKLGIDTSAFADATGCLASSCRIKLPAPGAPHFQVRYGTSDEEHGTAV